MSRVTALTGISSRASIFTRCDPTNPLVALIPAIEIEAMHRVVGCIGPELKLQPIDIPAYFMLSGLAGDEAVPSFGPSQEMDEA